MVPVSKKGVKNLPERDTMSEIWGCFCFEAAGTWEEIGDVPDVTSKPVDLVGVFFFIREEIIEGRLGGRPTFLRLGMGVLSIVFWTGFSWGVVFLRTNLRRSPGTLSKKNYCRTDITNVWWMQMRFNIKLINSRYCWWNAFVLIMVNAWPYERCHNSYINPL